MHRVGFEFSLQQFTPQAMPAFVSRATIMVSHRGFHAERLD